MKISVTKKGRKTEVPVKVETSPKTNEIEYQTISESPYSKKNLAEQLAMLDRKEMNAVVRAAKHLRKFVDLLKDDKKTDSWDDEWDDEQLDVEE